MTTGVIPRKAILYNFLTVFLDRALQTKIIFYLHNAVFFIFWAYYKLHRTEKLIVKKKQILTSFYTLLIYGQIKNNFVPQIIDISSLLLL